MADEENKYEIADDVREVAEKVCKDNLTFDYIHLNKVAFVRKNGNSKTCIANISGIHGKLACITDKKYVITVISDRYDDMSDEVKYKVIEHELMHISHDFDGGLYKHDVQDFSRMLVKYGIGWQNTTEPGGEAFSIPVNQDGKLEQ